MGLKEFLEAYSWLYKDDFDGIRMWAAMYNHQQELINFISTLAADIVNKANKEKHKTKEWAYYALMNLVPEITKETKFPVAINALRLCDMAYEANEDFVKVCDYIMESDEMDWAVVDRLHPEICLKYEEAKEKCGTQTNQSK